MQHNVVRAGAADREIPPHAGPGDTIRMEDGTYRGNVDITGSAGGGYGLHLDGASYRNLTGFTVTGGQ